MSATDVIINEVKHISRSLSGLHKKADRTNGRVAENDRRIIVLENREVVTPADCNAHRLSALRRTLFLILGALVSFAGGYALDKLTGG